MRNFKYFLLTMILATTAHARVANNVYVIPSSGSPLLPSWGKVNLSSSNAVIGLLPPSFGGLGGNFSSSTGAVSVSSGTFSAGTMSTTNGGTGLSAPTANSVLLTNGSSALQTITPGSSGNVLQSTGTTWQSASLASTYTAPTLQKFLVSDGAANYQFTVTSANATAASTYTNNGFTCTTLTTIVASTSLKMSCTGSPTASGTLTKSSGTGDSTISFSARSTIYILPTNPSPIYLKVRMVGGGGGGAGADSGSGDGVAGGNTTFGTSLLVANGGAGGTQQTTLAAPGTASLGTGPIGIALTGGQGGGAGRIVTGNFYTSGGMGGSSAFGGAGGGGNNGLSGLGGAASANTGSGGGGGSTASQGTPSGNGGSSGGYVDAIISSPSSTYTYTVGAGGAGNTASIAGGNGAAGIIIVEEHYQ